MFLLNLCMRKFTLLSSVRMVFMFGVTFVCEYKKQRWILHVRILHSFCPHRFTLN